MAEIATTVAVETPAASCDKEIADFVLNLGSLSRGIDGDSMVLLTEGTACWDQVTEIFNTITDLAKEQLELDLLGTGTGTEQTAK